MREHLFSQEASPEPSDVALGKWGGILATRYALDFTSLIMTTEELKRDFESAHIKHVHFKSKLRSFLFGNGGAEGPLRDPEQCSLGVWITSRMRGTGAYAHLPEARQFDRQHIIIHKEANRLMDLHVLGQSSEVGVGYVPLQVIADEMATLLRTMEAKLRTQAH